MLWCWGTTPWLPADWSSFCEGQVPVVSPGFPWTPQTLYTECTVHWEHVCWLCWECQWEAYSARVEKVESRTAYTWRSRKLRCEGSLSCRFCPGTPVRGRFSPTSLTWCSACPAPRCWSWTHDGSMWRGYVALIGSCMTTDREELVFCAPCLSFCTVGCEAGCSGSFSVATMSGFSPSSSSSPMKTRSVMCVEWVAALLLLLLFILSAAWAESSSDLLPPGILWCSAARHG